MDPENLERAKIAMEEYKVLHAEILDRNKVLATIVAAGIGGIVSLVSTLAFTHPKTMGWLILLVVAAMVTAWRLVDSDARNASRRIIEIEEYVQGLLGGDSKNPLSWERRFGILNRDYADRWKPFDYDKPR